MEPTCSISDCGKPVKARGWCSKHYDRWLTRGTTADPRLSPEDRFWLRVERDGPIPEHRPNLGHCWLWTGARNDLGYGRFYVGPGELTQAHRFAYELLVGPLPNGLVPDHLCRVPPCVRPSHLEVVTSRENTVRGNGWGGVNARKTHCPRGHAYDEANTYRNPRGARECRACKALYDRTRRIP